MKSNLSTIPKGDIPIETGKDGKKYYRLNYEVKIAFFSAHMNFSLWYKGKQYGKVNAQFA